MLEKNPESKVIIRFPDCDPFNHLNNARYIDYMINTREDHLLKYYDFDIYKMAMQTGISWVVAQNQIAYLSPANLMETVTIQTRLITYDERSLVMEALMWDEAKTQLKALLWTRFVHFNLVSKKSQTHSAELNSLFEQLHAPLSELTTFENRVHQFKL